MYDTVKLHIGSDGLPKVDLIDHVSQFIEVNSEGCNKQGQYVSGNLEQLKVTANPFGVWVSNSLCKYWHGENITELSLTDTKAAIEKLSDSLNLPMDRAAVYRLDFGHNIQMQYAISHYLPTLTHSGRYHRLEQPQSVYYKLKERELIFYDKTAEAKTKGIEAKANLLRYEVRLQKKVARQLKKPTITANQLCSPELNNYLNKYWKDQYNRIKKAEISNAIMNPDKMTPAIFMQYLASEGLQGMGLNNAYQIIKDYQKDGKLSAKNACVIRQKIKEIVQSDDCQKSDLISELNSKVNAF